MSLLISDYFREVYMKCGNTYDNFVFHNCPVELLDMAEESLNVPSEDCTPCVLRFGKDDVEALSKTLDQCADDYQKGIMARTYYYSKFMRELLHKFNCGYKDHTVESLDRGIEDLVSGDFQKARKFYLDSPLNEEIEWCIRKTGKIELDILLDNMNDIYLQCAINNSIASRTPYSIKVFNTGNMFASTYSTSGQLIQSTHDYLLRNIADYVKVMPDDHIM